MAAIPIAEPIERAVHHTAESFFGVTGTQKICRHHRGERQRDDARNENRAGERECKFTEERAGETALQRDRCVNGRECNRHRDDRPDQFARPFQCRVHAREAFAHMALDVFNHDNGIVHH